MLLRALGVERAVALDVDWEADLGGQALVVRVRPREKDERRCSQWPDEETLKRFLDLLGPERSARIRPVSSDAAAWIHDVVRGGRRPLCRGGAAASPGGFALGS